MQFLKAFIAVLFLLAGIAAKAQISIDTNELRIVTYNVKMLPRILAHLKHHPVKRARLIPAKLIEDSVHIVCFQEAFDGKSIRELKRLLKPHFPYTVGPANKRPGFKLSSGVIIFSKLPLSFISEIDFIDCEKEDCAARKGALLVASSWQGQPFQIMGTHAEAGGDLKFKCGQLCEMRDMVQQYKKDSVPQFLLGDFNMKKGMPVYDSLISIFGAEDGPLTGELQYTSDAKLNDMRRYNPDKRGQVDYILYKGNGVVPRRIEREVKRYQQNWDSKHKDLSDHFGVLMKVSFH
jgi:endonuclease/exonuclease/phosphatase family metal-dependent hydrolase